MLSFNELTMKSSMGTVVKSPHFKNVFTAEHFVHDKVSCMISYPVSFLLKRVSLNQRQQSFHGEKNYYLYYINYLPTT